MVSGENNQYIPNGGNFLSEQFNAEDLIEKIRWLLRGFHWDDDKKIWTNVIGSDDGKEIKSTPKLNEQGVLDITTELDSRIRNVYGGAKLTKVEIQTIRHSVGDVVWIILVKNRKKYNLEVEHLKSVLFMVDDQLLLFLSRTEDGGFIQFVKNIFTFKETKQTNTAESGSGFKLPGSNGNGGFF